MSCEIINTTVEQSEIVIMAVKPQVFISVAEDIKISQVSTEYNDYVGCSWD